MTSSPTPSNKKFLSRSSNFRKYYNERNLPMPKPQRTTPPKSQLNPVDRVDIALVQELEADPVKFIQSQLSAMLVAERTINATLYSDEHIDPSALSSSNKRFIDLAEAYKALPKQNDTGAKGGQRSVSELMQEAIAEGSDAEGGIADEVEQQSLTRNVDAF